jgi:hypothetical protein
MKRIILLAGLLLPVLFATAQPKVELFDYKFKPSKTGAYYYVTTEKTDTLWHRQAWFTSQRTLAMDAWYKDSACKVPHGAYKWYHPTRYLKTLGRYENGKKEGAWLEYNDEGVLIDSAIYTAGHLVGVRMKWYKNGMASDSLQFDGAGNGVQVSWYDDGAPSTAGYWTNETKKRGRWQYFQKNGSLLATEDYVDGKKVGCACYDDAGQPLDTALCAEKEAAPYGGLQGWKGFLERGLQRIIIAKASVLPQGQYTVVVRFVVNKDGSLSEFAPLTQYGQGLEEEVVDLLKRAPLWTPGKLFGRPVRSYHTQPVTFMISGR